METLLTRSLLASLNELWGIAIAAFMMICALIFVTEGRRSEIFTEEFSWLKRFGMICLAIPESILLYFYILSCMWTLH